MSIKMVVENRSQSVLIKVNAISDVIEYIGDAYIDNNIDVDAIYDADDDSYWEQVGIIIDSIVDYFNDCIDDVESDEIDIESDSEWISMSDYDKWMYILDTKPILRESMSINDVTGHRNPYFVA